MSSKDLNYHPKLNNFVLSHQKRIVDMFRSDSNLRESVLNLFASYKGLSKSHFKKTSKKSTSKAKEEGLKNIKIILSGVDQVIRKFNFDKKTYKALMNKLSTLERLYITYFNKISIYPCLRKKFTRWISTADILLENLHQKVKHLQLFRV
jgi:DNA repair ATPase RecN